MRPFWRARADPQCAVRRDRKIQIVAQNVWQERDHGEGSCTCVREAGGKQGGELTVGETQSRPRLCQQSVARPGDGVAGSVIVGGGQSIRNKAGVELGNVMLRNLEVFSAIACMRLEGMKMVEKACWPWRSNCCIAVGAVAGGNAAMLTVAQTLMLAVAAANHRTWGRRPTMEVTIEASQTYVDAAGSIRTNRAAAEGGARNGAEEILTACARAGRVENAGELGEVKDKRIVAKADEGREVPEPTAGIHSEPWQLRWARKSAKVLRAPVTLSGAAGP